MNRKGRVIAPARGPVWRPDAAFVQDHHNATSLNCVSPVRLGGQPRRDHSISEGRPKTYARQAPGPMSGLKGSWSTARVANPFARPADAKIPQAAPIPPRADDGSMVTTTRTAE